MKQMFKDDGCDSSLQKYKLKANHNDVDVDEFVKEAVIHPCKNTN